MTEMSPAVAEAIKMAIELEKDGYRFFKDAAAKTENSLGKKMFESLAADETNHLETFQRMFETIAGKETWGSIRDSISPAGKVPVFEDVSKKSPAKGTTSEIEALQLAMDVEKRAIEFFDKAAREADDPLAKEIFQKVREQEEYHYGLIEAQRDYVTKSGFWFDIAEFRMDGQY